MILRFTICLSVLALTSPAFGQSGALARGIELFDRADFEGAIRAFDEAEAGEGLERAELLDLYERRASAQLALDDRDAMRRDLAKLASLDPEHAFGPATRPEVRVAFEHVGADRQPLELRVTPSSEVGAASLRAEVSNDPDGLVREVRVYGRSQGGEWRSGQGSVFLPASAGATLEYYATAVGPGGAAIAVVGTADAPLSYAYAGPIGSDGGDGDDDDDRGGVGGLAIGLAIGGGVLAAIVAIIIIAAVTSGNDATQPDSPVIYD